MKILREGDRGTALATDGRGWVPVTYQYRSVRLEKTGVDVPNVLVGVDAETDQILLIPTQSTPRLKAAREQVKEETFQVKIPRELDDVLVLLPCGKIERVRSSLGGMPTGLLELLVHGMARLAAGRDPRSPRSADSGRGSLRHGPPSRAPCGGGSNSWPRLGQSRADPCSRERCRWRMPGHDLDYGSRVSVIRGE